MGKIAVGAIVALPSAWYLFVRLDVIHAPGLIEFFPQAYALLAALILAGIAMMTAGAWSLTRAVSQR